MTPTDNWAVIPILLLLAILSGCIGLRKLAPMSSHDVACRRYHWCGEFAGAYRIGSDVCYTPDLRRDPFREKVEMQCD